MDVEYETSPSTGDLLSVIFLSIEEYQGIKIVHFFYEETNKWAIIRNPEILCGRLIQGALIKILLFSFKESDSHVLEATLIINENDMLPEDFVPLLANNMPAYRTSFGFISKPSENKGRYYTLLKQADTGMLLCTGEYIIEKNEGKCLNFDGKWKIQNGIVENYFLNRNWPESEIKSWEYDNLNLCDTLDYLTISDLNLEFRDYIACNKFLEFFYSDDWSPKFYRTQAKLGFIAITCKRNNSVQLLPQLQSAYALLDWKNLTIDKKVGKIINGSRIKDENIQLYIESDPEVVLKNLSSVWKESSWLVPSYVELMKKLASAEECANDSTFRLWGVTLTVGELNNPVAGELGYTIGRTYTSLTGFFNREKKAYNNLGKLQMVKLAEVLENAGILFWNLGHPHMKYKTDLGAKIVAREDFLVRWDEAVKGDSIDLNLRKG